MPRSLTELTDGLDTLQGTESTESTESTRTRTSTVPRVRTGVKGDGPPQLSGLDALFTRGGLSTPVLPGSLQVVGPSEPAEPDPLSPPVVVDVDLATVSALLPFGYLSGAAGTGKTFLARALIQSMDPGRALLMATTGIAAINLGDATTINAALGYFDTASLYDNYARGFLQHRLRMLRRSGIRLLVLDEVSMMPADQLTLLVQALDEIEQSKDYDAALEQVVTTVDDERRMGLLLLGDFAQLGPVKAPFAFESPAWGRFQTLRLTQNRRQGDQGFIGALRAIREGHPEMALDAFTPCFQPRLDIDFPGTTIVAKNDAVDRINGLRHAKLPGELLTWESVRQGEQQTDWTKQIPAACQVKVGALVMILANKAYPKIDPGDLSEFEYVNGDLAEVLEKRDGGIRVRLQRSGDEVTVTPFVKEWREPTGKRKPPYTVRGSVAYMPLRLAYASTVHKCQGLTLDRIQVSISDHFMGNPGSLYVALSRGRSLEGLRVVGSAQQLVRRCVTDPRVRDYV